MPAPSPDTSPLLNRLAHESTELTAVHQLFERQVRLTPGACAIVAGNVRLNYEDLNRHANQLARHLQGRGVGPGQRVGICLERSIDVAVAALAVLKSGAAYVPLDPAYPAARLQFMVEDALPCLVIGHLSGVVTELPLLDFAAEQGKWSGLLATNLELALGGDTLAYLIYTSGSSGRPKGVMIPHRALVNHAAAIVGEFQLRPSDRVLQFASFSFDVAAEELFPTWAAGATVVLRDEECLRSFAQFSRFVQSYRVSLLNLPASFWSDWVKEQTRTGAVMPETLRLMVVGNESVLPETYALWRQWVGDSVSWLNAYGPTEATITATIFRPPPASGPITSATMPIGRPLKNVTVHLLDTQLQPVPAGAKGELCLGGKGVALGYWKQPELTGERFVADPTNPGSGRIYRTGDWARFLPDGNLEFLGRVDDQVKVRGFRIEPGEVEAALASHPLIREAAVVRRETDDGEAQLVGYYVSEARREPAELWPCPGDYQIFDDVMYYAMTNDHLRNARYRAAFERHVKGKVAVDIGTGRDALLARMMVEAGAEKVYAIEVQDAPFRSARKTVRQLGLENKIIVLQGDSATVQLPQLVDVCASELIGTIGNSEGAAAILNNAQRFLRPGGTMIPQRCVTLIGAVMLPDELRSTPTFAELPAHYAREVFRDAGRDFDLRLAIKHLPSDHVLSDTAVFEELDFTKEVRAEFQRLATLTVQRPGFMDGFVLWLNLFPAEGELIDTLTEGYSWLPVFFPVFDMPLAVEAGDVIEFTCGSRFESDPRRPDYFVHGKVKRGKREVCTFRHDSRLFPKSGVTGAFHRKLLSNVAAGTTPASRELSRRALRDHVRRSLPTYMVPNDFFLVASLPRLPNGKLDRNALAKIAASARGRTTATKRPTTPTEQALIDIWMEVLGLDAITAQDDFFTLGGHSLHATQIIARIAHLLNVELPLTVLFDHPTVAELADVLVTLPCSDDSSATKPILPVPRDRSLPLSFAQERVWFIEQLTPNEPLYNMPEAVHIGGPLQVAALEQALNEIVRRHEILRTTYTEENGRPHLAIQPAPARTLPVVDLRHLPLAEAEIQARALATEQARLPIPLDQAPLLRAALWQVGASEFLLGVTIHHIAADGWSMGVFYRELVALYEAFAAGTAPNLAEPALQYADFAVWQRAFLQGAVLDAQLSYWKKQLHPPGPVLDLPLDRPRSSTQTYRGGKEVLTFSPRVTARVTKFSQAEKVTAFMTLLAAFQALLYRYTGQTDITVGSPVAGRRGSETEQMIGFFVNTLVLRTDVSGEPSFRQLLQRVRATTLAAFAHQDLPFEKLVEAVQPERDPRFSPLFQVMFSLQNAPLAKLGGSGLSWRTEELFPGVALFDLVLNIVPQGDGLQIELVYNRDLFDPATPRTMLCQYQAMLEGAMSAPAERVAFLPMLPDNERNDLDLAALSWQMRRQPGVTDCVVLSRTLPSGVETLVAYVVPGSSFVRQSVYNAWKRAVALTGMRRAVVVVQSLPRTSEGDVDVSVLEALPVLDDSVCQQVSQFWRAHEGVKDISVTVELPRRVLPRWHVTDLVPPSSLTRRVAAAPARSSEVSRAKRTSTSAILSMASGGDLRVPPGVPADLPGMLRRASEVSAGITYIRSDGTLQEQTYAQLLEEAETVLGGLRRAGGKAQEEVILLLPEAIDFLPAFWGCVLGGFLPAPVTVPPSFEETNLAVKRLQQIKDSLGNPLIITTAALSQRVAQVANGAAGLARVVTIEDLRRNERDRRWHVPSGIAPAVLMPTSGSTGTPKLVTLTHHNIVSRTLGSLQCNSFAPSEVSLNWMPLEHVAGLIYFHLRDVFLGCRQLQIATSYILEEPVRWLDLVERFKVTVTFAPNFAFALINDRSAQVQSRPRDVSSLRYLLNGAERIVPRTARAFVRLLTPFGLRPDAMRPAWGMAETCSGVVYSDQFRLNTTSDNDSNVVVGRPIPGVQLRIVDPDGQPIEEGVVGRLQVRGETVTPGYHRQPALNAAAFVNGWFDTGDLGSLQAGALTVTGREKEVIIINGVNFQGTDLESIVDQIPGIEPSYTAACAIRLDSADTDTLAVFFSPRARNGASLRPLLLEIRNRLTRHAGISPSLLIPLPPAAVPKTSAGKIQRSLLREQLETGAYRRISRDVDLLLENEHTIPQWFYRRRWRQQRLRSSGTRPRRPTLILADPAGLGQEVAARLGEQAILVEQATTFVRVGSRHYRIDPNQPKHFELLFDRLRQEKLSPELVLHLWAYGDQPTTGLASSLGLVQALLREVGTDPLDWIVATTNSQFTREDEGIDPERAAILGWFRTVPREHSSWRCRCIDFGVTSPHDVALLLQEIAAEEAELEVAYRSGVRLVPGLTPLKMDQVQVETQPFRPGGLYLVSGGSGGIAQILTEHLRTLYQAKLLLVSRSGGTGPVDGLVGKRGRPLSCAEVSSVALDISNTKALSQAVANFEARWQGKLEGVIHLAGVAARQSIAAQSPGSLEIALAAKVAGTEALGKILADRPQATFIAFSSTVATFGAREFSAYAAANRYLEAFAHNVRRSGHPAFCFSWSMWDGIGMNRDYPERQVAMEHGFLPLQPSAALLSLEACLARDVSGVFIGLDGGNPTLRGQVDASDLALEELTVRVVTKSGEDLPQPLPTLPARDAWGIPFGCMVETVTQFPWEGHGPVAPRKDEVPSTPVEKRMAEAWKEILGIPSIGVHDNFFELGGHSLLATQLVSRLRGVFQAEIPLQWLFQFPTIGGLAKCLPEVSPTKPQMHHAPMKPIARRGRFPISFAQERLWFFDRLMPGSAFYNIPLAMRVTGPLNVPALQRSFNEMIRRHETLRTTFGIFDDVPMQVIAASGQLSLPAIDLSTLEPTERETVVTRLTIEEGSRPFDLTTGPLFRACLFQLTPHESVLMITFHHVISDGWSQGVFVRELAALYGAFAAGRPSPLSELTIQYADFAQWQRSWIEGNVLDQQLAYWRKQLEGCPALIELPADRSRPPSPTFRGGTETFSLPSALAEELRGLSRRCGATLFMTLLAAFKTLLSRYTGLEDIVVGTPIANRNRVETENLLGFLANTLVLRTDVGGDPTFCALLGRVKEMAISAYAHQDLPFEKLVEALNPERDLSRQPLFQIMFVLQNIPKHDLQLPGLNLKPIPVDIGMALFDLTLYFTETENEISGALEYNADLFEPRSISSLAEHFVILLRAIVADPDRPLSQLPLMSPAESEQITVEWNQTRTAYPRQQCVHEVFSVQAAQTPAAIALEFLGHSLSYIELEQRANQLAHHLVNTGLGPDKLVGIFMDRSVEMIISLLAVLKAGGAYLPLAMDYPAERIAFMLRDSGVELLLTQGDVVNRLPAHAAPVIHLEQDKARWADCPRTPPPNRATPDNLAYVMYTSGSTGNPKGVNVPHRGIVRLVKNTNYAPVDATDALLQMAPISFDASTFEIWGALLNGARLVVMPPGTPGIAEIGAALRKHQITTLWLTADLFHLMVDERPDDLAPLRRLLAGGDVLSVAHVNRLLDRAPNLTLINGYGPTENTTFAACYPVRSSERFSKSVPIGRPISNTQIYVLDARLRPVPVGLTGEIFVGGDGLARGYRNQDELTSLKFIPNPFSTEDGARLYRTGDYGRFLPDGNIEFVGRRDDQVKVRGFRIELREVEAAMESHPSIARAVVMARTQASGDKTLAGYFSWRVPGEGATVALREFLKQRLPDYMIPAVFLEVAEWPLSPNGKVDRRALPEPGDLRPELGAAALSPRDLLEVQLTQIWEAVLGVHSIGVRDNFFELGGHSLLAVRLFIEIEKRIGKRLPLATLFQAPTVEQLAAALRHDGWTPPWSSLVAIKPGGFKPPFFIIHGVGGNVLNFHGLARYLGEDQPVYGLQSQGLDGKQAPPTRMEDMAAHYIQEIRTVQPTGPYFLGGMSFGGVVAFEMAQQLHAQQEKVALLALLDSYPLGYSELMPITGKYRRELGLLRERIQGHWRSFMERPKGQRLSYFVQKGRTLQRRLRSRLWRVAYRVYTTTGRELPDGLQNVKEANFLAAKEYVTKVYTGGVTLFIATEQSLGTNFDPMAVWSKLASGGVEIYEIPGNHVTIIEEPHVQVLADRLKAALAKARSTG